MSNIDLTSDPDFFSRQVAEARRFFLRPKESADRSIVAGAGFERVSADYRINRAQLRFSAIEFVVGGHGQVILRDREYALLPGVMFIYDEKSPHTIVTDPGRPLEKYFVDLRQGVGRKAIRQANLPFDRAWLVEEPVDIRRLFDELLHFGTGSNPGKQSICDRLLQIILLSAHPLPLPTRSKDQKAFQTYQRCCRMIDARAASLFSLKELAAACELDPAYVCRLFRRFDRQTAHERLTRRRMDIAAARLYSSSLTVKQLAEELGHSDPFNFSRQFKSVFGLAPGQFRSAYTRLISR